MKSFIYRWIKQGLVETEDQHQALQLAGERPTPAEWLLFSKKLLWMLGLLSLALGVVFFVAFNWNDMGRMFKFVTLQVFLLVAIFAYLFNSKSFWLAQSLLLTVVIVLGALLALFGQTYQTGADPWQLFAVWALLIVPLVVFSRSEVLWLFLGVLINVALGLYMDINHGFFGWLVFAHFELWVFLIINVIVLIGLEMMSSSYGLIPQFIRLSHRWAAQIIGVAVMFILTLLGMELIWDQLEHRLVQSLLYVILMSGAFIYYRFQVKDLLLLTAWVLALMSFVLTFLTHAIFSHLDAGGLLLMAVSLIGLSTLAVRWIKRTHDVLQLEESS